MSVAWFDGVTFTVEVAFTTAPLAASPSWTDVSAYLVEAPSLRFGRESEFSPFSPATCELVFKNHDRRFDPEYSSGPYYGNLQPMKKLRVRATYAATTYDLFTGFVQGWPQAYQSALSSTVTVRCVDGHRFLEQAKLNRSAYEAVVMADAPFHYWPMQEQNTSSASGYEDVVAGRQMRPTSLNGLPVTGPVSTVAVAPIGADSVVAPPTFALAAGTPTETMAVAEFVTAGWLDVDPHGLDFWCDFGSHDQSRETVVRAVNFTGNYAHISVDVNYWQLRVEFSDYNGSLELVGDTGVPVPFGLTHVAVWFNGTNVKLYLNGVLKWTGTPSAVLPGTFYGNGLAIGSGYDDNVGNPASNPLTGLSSFAHVAVYPTGTEPNWQGHYLAGITAFGHPYSDRSGARVGRVLDEAGWPAADRALSTGDTVHGPYIPNRMSAMEYLRDVEVAEDGYLFIDGAGKVVLRDRNWQWAQTTAATFSDDGTDIDYTDITIDANTVDAIRNKVSVTYGPNGAYLFEEDVASRTAYGPSTETLSTPTVPGSVTARGLAAYKVRTMKDPQTRITRLQTEPREQPATAFPSVLGLSIGQRIAVERRPQSVGSAIVKTLVVQGYEHRWDSDWWTTTVYLSPAPLTAVEAPYLTVGGLTRGKIGAAAGNKIPF